MKPGFGKQPVPVATSLQINQSLASKASQAAAEHAAGLFRTRQLWCSGAVLVALNKGLSGGLNEADAIRLTSGLGHGLSGSGCICGALSGGVLALGLFLGHGRPCLSGDREVLGACRELHQLFLKSFGATCCRILTARDGAKRQTSDDACVRRTAESARMACNLIFARRPDLVPRIDWDILQARKHRTGVKVGLYAREIFRPLAAIGLFVKKHL